MKLGRKFDLVCRQQEQQEQQELKNYDEQSRARATDSRGRTARSQYLYVQVLFINNQTANRPCIYVC